MSLPPRDVVHRARHVRQEVRVPVRVARDQGAELDPLCDLRHRPQKRPALEVLAVRVPVEREEVIPVEERVRPHLLDPEPRVAHLGVARLLRVDLGPDPCRHKSPPIKALCPKGPLYGLVENVGKDDGRLRAREMDRVSLFELGP